MLQLKGKTSMLVTSPFMDERTWIIQNRTAFVRPDNYPISPGHALVIPKRCVASIFELTHDEIIDVLNLISEIRQRLLDEHRPDGFNVGINDGSVAGQTVMHAHVHVIPRYNGDHHDPRGGIRAVIPEKRLY